MVDFNPDKEKVKIEKMLEDSKKVYIKQNIDFEYRNKGLPVESPLI